MNASPKRGAVDAEEEGRDDSGTEGGNYSGTSEQNDR